MTSTRFIALDGWRGVCALLVAVHNLNFGYWLPQAPFVAHSSLFVDFFFVLSGFVITHACMEKIDDVAGVGTFMLRRFGRLWPLHVAVLIALVGLYFFIFVAASMLHLRLDISSHQDTHSIRTILMNFFLLQAFDVNSRITWNSPSWSISTELWTYLLFSGICLVGSKRRPSVFIAGGIAAFSGIVLVLFSPNFLETNTDYAFFRCLFGFFSGHLVYRAREVISFQIRRGEAFELLALSLVVTFVFFSGSDIWSMAAPPIFGFAVWVFAQERGPISRLLKTRPFVQLGIWSYSIYMVHWIIRNILFQATAVVDHVGQGEAIQRYLPQNGEWTTRAVLIGYLIAVVLLASLTYRFIEQPGRRFFYRLSDKLPAGPGSTDRCPVLGNLPPPI